MIPLLRSTPTGNGRNQALKKWRTLESSPLGSLQPCFLSSLFRLKCVISSEASSFHHRLHMTQPAEVQAVRALDTGGHPKATMSLAVLTAPAPPFFHALCRVGSGLNAGCGDGQQQPGIAIRRRGPGLAKLFTTPSVLPISSR